MSEQSVRWGLLSTARINERLIPPIRTAARSELLAVASRDQDRAEGYAAEWEIPHAYGSYEAMLADPDVDAVYIPLPNALHAEWAIRCAEKGKHILCEKPMATTPEDVARMAGAAQQNGVILQEAAMMRYHAQTRELRALISRGDIGEVRVLRGMFTFTLTRKGDIRTNRELEGGALWDLGSYCVSFMRAMTATEPVAVQAWQVTNEEGVDLSCMGQMHFPDGVMGQFFSSFAALPCTEAEIVGSAGMVRLDVPWLNQIGATANVQITRGGAAAPAGTFSDSADHLQDETVAYESINAYQDEIDNMVACILDGAEPVISLIDSQHNIAAIAALYQSARENRMVSL